MRESENIEPKPRSYLLRSGDLDIESLCHPENEVVHKLLSQIIQVLKNRHPDLPPIDSEKEESEINDLRIFNGLKDYFVYTEKLSGQKWSQKDRILFRLQVATAGALFVSHAIEQGGEKRMVIILSKSQLEKKLVHELTHAGQSILGYLDNVNPVANQEYAKKTNRVQLLELIGVSSIIGGIAIACFRPDQAIAIRMLAVPAMIGIGGMLPARKSYENVPNEEEAFELMELVEDK